MPNRQEQRDIKRFEYLHIKLRTSSGAVKRVLRCRAACENEYFITKFYEFITKLCALFLYIVVSGLYFFLAIMQHLVEWSPLIESWLISASVMIRNVYCCPIMYSLFLCVLCFTLFVKRCVCQCLIKNYLIDWLIDCLPRTSCFSHSPVHWSFTSWMLSLYRTNTRRCLRLSAFDTYTVINVIATITFAVYNGLSNSMAIRPFLAVCACTVQSTVGVGAAVNALVRSTQFDVGSLGWQFNRTNDIRMAGRPVQAPGLKE